MFIYNIKLKSKIIYRILLIIIIASVLFLCGIVAYRLYNATIKVDDNINNNENIEITNENYSTILKSVHENIDTYVGKRIKFSGFIYRVYDIDDNQFVLARNMLIDSNNQTVVVGFLCTCNNADDYKNYTWVEIDGKITKGNYHGDMPILQIENIKKIEKPNNEYVYLPDKTYIPTSIS